jgi:hypothetical protein
MRPSASAWSIYMAVSPTAMWQAAAIRLRTRDSLRIWHPQIVRVAIPARCARRKTRASRRRLSDSLDSQNTLCVFGGCPRGQPECPCQKHPCTNTATFRSVPIRRTSGEPHENRGLRSCRTFSRAATRLTAVSISVPLVRTERISRDRSIRVSRSMLRVRVVRPARRSALNVPQT